MTFEKDFNLLEIVQKAFSHRYRDLKYYKLPGRG